mgnify:CR=1 FL=1
MFKNLSMLLKARTALKQLLATKSTETAATWAGLIITALNLLAPAAVAWLAPMVEKVTGQSLAEVAGILFTLAAARLFKSGGGAAWAKPEPVAAVSPASTLYPPKP